MRLSSYLAKSRHGIYHLRLYVPKPLQSLFKTAEIRRSLGTRDPREARSIAYRLAPQIKAFWQGRMSTDDEILADFRKRHQAAFDALDKAGALGKIRIELGRGGAFEFDTPEEGKILAEWLRQNAPDALNDLTALDNTETSSRTVVERPRIVRNKRGKGQTYGDLIEPAFIEKSVEYKNPRSAQDFRQKAQAFSDFIGAMPIDEISSADFSRFKQKLIKDGASAQTVNKYVQGVGIPFSYAIRQRLYIGESPTAKQRAKVDKSSTRAPFQPSHIEKIFAPDRLRDVSDPAEFWFPLIGLHTGMRVAEIGQLRLSDIYEKDGGHVIDINETADDASVKTKASRRVIPMPPALVDLGFLDYIADVKTTGAERVFPWLSLTKQGYGANVSKTFSRRLEAAGIKTKALTFHSLRHTANKHLAEAGVDEAKRAAMLGHDHDTINTVTYHGTVSLAVLAREVAPLLRFASVDYKAIRRERGAFLPFLQNPPQQRRPKQPEKPSKAFRARR